MSKLSTLAATAALFLPAAAYADCPDTSLPVIHAPPGTGAYKLHPRARVIIDMADHPVTVDNRDGIDIKSPYPGTCIERASVVSTISRNMGWEERHHLKPSGDAIHYSHAEDHRGPESFVVTDFYTDNAEDSIGPPKGCKTAPEGSSFLVIRGRAVYTRDDFVEDDGRMPGEISDVLVDGTHMFVSEKQHHSCGHKGGELHVHDSLVHIACMPDDRQNKSTGGCPLSDHGLRQTTGQLFKFDSSSGFVRMENVIARIDGTPASGLDDMDFPEGVYRDVIVVWGGAGDYPRPVPAGVTVTKDLGVWDRARAAWLASHRDLAH